MKKLHYKKTNPQDFFETRGTILEDYKSLLYEVIKSINKDHIKILDPCAGTKALDIPIENVTYDKYDINPRSDDVKYADFLASDFPTYDLIVCNPPFTYGEEFFDKCRQLSSKIIFISSWRKNIVCNKFNWKASYSKDFNILAPVYLIYYDASKFFEMRSLPKISELSLYTRLNKNYIKKISFEEYDPNHHYVFRSSFKVIKKERLFFDMTNPDNWKSKASSLYSTKKIGELLDLNSIYFKETADLINFRKWAYDNWEELINRSYGHSMFDICKSNIFITKEEKEKLENQLIKLSGV